MILFVLLLISKTVFAQSFEERKGNVSFISSQNVYVRFSDTDGIKEGDTLYTRNGTLFSPVIRARFISATSVAGELLNGNRLKQGDSVYVMILVADKIEEKKVTRNDNQIRPEKSFQSERKTDSRTEKLNGRLSVSSYSNYANSVKGDFQRWRYTLSFNGKNIGESPVSVRTHLNFNYRTNEWSEIKNDLTRNIRVYDLSLAYQISEKSRLMLGRQLNEKITNVGPVDGIQFSQSMGLFNTGLFTGSRPDFTNLGFNLKLFQYGVYINRTDTVNNRNIDNTVAFINQTNNFNTDRRLLYFQHNNNYFRSLSVFLSAEADLFKKINNENINELSLTGLFLSLRYNPFTFASVNLSYDARRNVIYYETYKNFLETLLENEMRQGFRGGINLRPYKNIYSGFNIGYRFRKGDLRPSNDLGAYLSYSMIPYIEVSPALSYTRLKSSFISGDVFGAMITRQMELFNSSVSLTYRNSQYTYIRNFTSVQNSVSADIASRITKQFYLSAGWEGIFEGKSTSGRVLLNLTSRL
jgi:hypothetical protein